MPYIESTEVLFATTTRFGAILLFFIFAWLVSLISQPLARWIVGIRKITADKATWSEKRKHTLIALIASMITVISFLLAIFASLRLFIQNDTLFWVIGLFSAGFGIGARAIVADVLAGVSFIFRNTFAIGDKIIFLIGANAIEGVVEQVNVSATQVRAPTGELFTVPNGEISVVRNFMRANFSGARFCFSVPTAQLNTTLTVLDSLGQEAVGRIPGLLEPWHAVMVGEQMGSHTELTVIAKAAFGQGAALKIQMAQEIYTGLERAGVVVQG